MSQERLAPAALVPIRRAASVLLIRDGSEGLEVFVQHRVSTMDFAAGMVVFPGGRVDAQDQQSVNNGELDQTIINTHRQRWAHTSVWDEGEEKSYARAGEILCAAVREVFEETGLRLDPAQLMPWANWVTPVGFPRRFDTYFFVAALNAGQEPAHQTTEALRSEWARPEQLFTGLEQGTLKMMRPTQRTLLDVMETGTITEILRSTPIIRAVHPDPTDSMSAHPVRESELLSGP